MTDTKAERAESTGNGKGLTIDRVFTTEGVHPYDQVTHCLRLNVTQTGLEQGVVSLPHEWRVSRSTP